MSNITKAFGWALMAFGVVQFFLSKHKHITGLFPSLIGGLLVALGFAAKDERLEKAAVLAAGGVALVGVAVPTQSLVAPGLFPSTAAPAEPYPQRRLVQGVTVLLCALYLLWAITDRATAKIRG